MARGLRLRHDHGSNYLADDFQQEVAFFGIESSPSFVREPEGNGVAERFIRTLKENLLWVRSFDDHRGTPPGLARVQADIQRTVDAGEIRLSKPRPGATRPRRAGRGRVEANTVKPLSKNPGAVHTYPYPSMGTRTQTTTTKSPRGTRRPTCLRRSPTRSIVRVKALLDENGFDAFVERQCERFYAATRGVVDSLTTGIYFRALLVGYFEGIDSERGIAWRAADSLTIRCFLGIAVDEDVPDHSTISRTRRLIDVETHRVVFTWVQQRLVASGVLKGATIGIDATTLEANAAIRSIVRRETGEDFQAYLTGLAQASGIATPTRDDLARLNRKRKKTTSNKDWRSPVDPDAKVAKMKDGRTHLAHKVEHAVDLDTGAVVAVTVQGADTGDTTTICDTTVAAADQIEDAQAELDDPQAFTALVADQGLSQ